MFWRVDWVLLIAVLGLTAIGLVMVDSTGSSFAEAGLSAKYGVEHQTVFAIIGLLLLFVSMTFDYHRLEELAYPLWGLILLALLAVRAIGRSSLGAARSVSVGPISIQPSEFGVIAVAAACALYISRHESELDLRRLATLLAIAMVPMALVFLQPDLGTTIITGLVFLSLLFFAGLRMRYLVGLTAIVVAVVIAAFALHLVPAYQLHRIQAFLNPTKYTNSYGYNVLYSKEAIGAGGVGGTGLFNGQVTNLAYVPIQYEDFIFSAVGEQLGFIGSVVVIGLYSIVSFRIFRAMHRARDSLGRLLCGAALVFLVFSVFENIGMAIGLMPVTGIPLPFISYGGSALFAFFAAIGLVANVEIHRGGSR
ncbi:MAG TPA: FtsW/RodA/SpoVE family cell cycle protein [Acidimicrobiales bacterium]|nr:FtsW/RodA/SpoVE family cell cycle protein [Acidimicrobiales bacterium]